MEEEGNEHIFTDQTGHFPKKSSQGNQYIMVLSHPNSNAILQEAMKNRTSGEMNKAYQVLLDRLKVQESNPSGTSLTTSAQTNSRQQLKRTK
jgi:hypothetical protein